VACEYDVHQLYIEFEVHILHEYYVLQLRVKSKVIDLYVELEFFSYMSNCSLHFLLVLKSKVNSFTIF